MSLRSKLLASALAGALVLAPVQVQIQKKDESFSFSVERAEAFAPAISISALESGLTSVFQSALPAIASSVFYVGLAVAGVGLLVWGGKKLIDYFSSTGALSVSSLSSSGDLAEFYKSLESSTGCFRFLTYVYMLPKDAREVLKNASDGTTYSWYDGYYHNVCTRFKPRYEDPQAWCCQSHSVSFSNYQDTVLHIEPSKFSQSISSMPKADYFFADKSQAQSSLDGDLYVADVPLAEDSDDDVVPVPNLLPDTSTDSQNPADDAVTDSASSDTDAQNPADTAPTDSSDTTTDAQNPADDAVTDSASSNTDAQNPADTAVTDSSDASADSQNPADTATADSSNTATDTAVTDTATTDSVDDDVTANSTVLPETPTFNATVEAPEVPNILDKFKSIASSLDLTDRVTTSFSGSCSISGSLTLFGNSVSYDIDFCPYASYLEQAGNILVMITGFASLLIMFGL